jgi:hypothetical protein
MTCSPAAADAPPEPPEGGESGAAETGAGAHREASGSGGRSPDEGPGVIPIDSRVRKERRSGGDRRQGRTSVAQERRSGQERRRGSDRRRPDRKRSINAYELSEEARELAEAVARFRREHDNRFPTAEQLVLILRDLGYAKQG